MTIPTATPRIALAATILGCILALPAAAPAAGPAGLPPSATPSVVKDACPPQAEGAVCGHIDVPLDRADPSAGTIPLAFELYRHTDAGPAKSVIMINFGGPGAGTTPMRGIARFWLDSLLDRRDLLLLDVRGRGRPKAIDCPDYQHDTGGDLLSQIAACANQLGADAVRYSTAEIAHDYEAVRAALGYDKVDFVAASYGGIDAAAYATRFGGHLRSLLLDAPSGELTSDVFERTATGARRNVERVGVLCGRSVACGRSAREATDEVEALVSRLRREPVEGTALDASGSPHDVTVDPTYLLVNVLDNPGDLFLTSGEVPAAAAALRRGDAAPLLRLGAEGAFPDPDDSGDPAEFSEGAFSATFCVDNPWPWSADASLSQRQDEWARAVEATPDEPFAPFRAEEVMLSASSQADLCLPWPQTGSRPPVEPGARYPKVPTLVLNGDLDVNIGTVAETAALYPNAELVTFTGAGHPSQAFSRCANDLAIRFIRTRELGDTSCATSSPFDYPGVAAFPRRASQSPAAAPRRGNDAGLRSLRVARVAADAALDALKRSFQSSSGDGPALRGGTFHTDYADAFTTTLTGARWTEDVAVDGTLQWSFDGGPLDADLQVDGPGRRDGRLHLEGGWLIPGAARSIQITGTLGGKHIAASVPST